MPVPRATGLTPHQPTSGAAEHGFIGRQYGRLKVDHGISGSRDFHSSVFPIADSCSSDGNPLISFSATQTGGDSSTAADAHRPLGAAPATDVSPSLLRHGPFVTRPFSETSREARARDSPGPNAECKLAQPRSLDVVDLEAVWWNYAQTRTFLLDDGRLGRRPHECGHGGGRAFRMVAASDGS